MRIAWFTPFSGCSMIARYSGIVTRELSRYADVDIWHPPAPRLRATALRTIAMPRGVRVSPSMLGTYDLAVYNLGDEEDSWIAEAACAAPGLAILHAGVETAARRAYGVVVHSEFARKLAAGVSNGRVAMIPIAQEKLPGSRDGRRGLGVSADTLLVLATSTGDGRAALPALLGALAAVPGGRFICAVAGPVAPLERVELERRAAGRLRMIGPVSEDVLRPWIAEADVCVELRHPAVELAPALPALFMLHAKPVIVSGAGCYAELPGEAVVKVRPDRETEDLEVALRRLASCAADRRGLGGQARRFARETFNPRKYAASLLSLAEALLPVAPVLQCVDTMAGRLAEIGVEAGAAVVDRVAREAGSLFDGEFSSSKR